MVAANFFVVLPVLESVVRDFTQSNKVSNGDFVKKVNIKLRKKRVEVYKA